MLLVTGATGFIGQRVLSSLNKAGYAVRILLKPSRQTPRLPKGTTVEVALTSLSDMGGIRAAMVGVDSVIHLASEEHYGRRADLWRGDVEGTENLAHAAAEAGVARFVFLSHLGADRSSAYPVLKAKAAAEEHVRASEVPFTILRCGVVFGEDDHFTTSLAKVGALMPVFFPLVGQGEILVQPLWVEDLVTTLMWLLEEPSSLNRRFEVAGTEQLSLAECIDLIFASAGIRRVVVPVGAPYLRAGTALLERLLPHPPLTSYSLDYVAANRTTDLDSLPRVIGLQPSRMVDRLDYLERVRWGVEMIRDQLGFGGYASHE
jgi:NADH dehydrogenase